MAAQGAQHGSVPSLLQRCLGVICTHIKRYEGLGGAFRELRPLSLGVRVSTNGGGGGGGWCAAGVLDDALLRQLLSMLKLRGNVSRGVMATLLGHQLLTLDLEDVFVSDGCVHPPLVCVCVCVCVLSWTTLGSPTTLTRTDGWMEECCGTWPRRVPRWRSSTCAAASRW